MLPVGPSMLAPVRMILVALLIFLPDGVLPERRPLYRSSTGYPDPNDGGG